MAQYLWPKDRLGEEWTTGCSKSTSMTLNGDMTGSSVINGGHDAGEGDHGRWYVEASVLVEAVLDTTNVNH